MKVIDIQPYRLLKEIRLLEQKIERLTGTIRPGTIREIKICFKEWLRINA